MSKTIMIERGHYKLGFTTSSGEKREPEWVNCGTSNGIVVAVFDENEEQVGQASLFGTYQMQDVTECIKELLEIGDKEEPNYIEILKGIVKEHGIEIACEHCNNFAPCGECRLSEYE